MADEASRDLSPYQALYTFSLVMRDIMGGAPDGVGEQVFSAINLLRIAGIGKVPSIEVRKALEAQGIFLTTPKGTTKP